MREIREVSQWNAQYGLSLSHRSIGIVTHNTQQTHTLCFLVSKRKPSFLEPQWILLSFLLLPFFSFSFYRGHCSLMKCVREFEFSVVYSRTIFLFIVARRNYIQKLCEKKKNFLKSKIHHILINDVTEKQNQHLILIIRFILSKLFLLIPSSIDEVT